MKVLARTSRLLKNAFDAFDQEKKGYIDTTMVGTILSMLGHQLDDKVLAEIIAEVDEDGSGQIEFAEFTTLAARFLVEEDAEAMQAELKEAFRLYDKEGNGYITTGVLREILRELDDKLTNEDLDMMIEEIDSDGSGTVDFDAAYYFQRLMRNTAMRLLFPRIPKRPSRLTTRYYYSLEYKRRQN
ncbi:unnamed protein product [Hermetia illucens]|uniref:EF-hand domain-containing protein n=1 Tax=Hermetia illucens TaxID=343691 RepID=A0A7R8V578_HERIL|nr:troponin C isoform X3 [Hermetia illucens]CAD7092355.1 unnamed protein product [Hermetia illucens]